MKAAGRLSRSLRTNRRAILSVKRGIIHYTQVNLYAFHMIPLTQFSYW